MRKQFIIKCLGEFLVILAFISGTMAAIWHFGSM
jgi:hypothetical protein